MATYAGMLRDILWPNGSQFQPNGGSSKGASGEEQPARDEPMKLRTRVLCRAVIFGSVAGRYFVRDISISLSRQYYGTVLPRGCIAVFEF